MIVRKTALNMICYLAGVSIVLVQSENAAEMLARGAIQQDRFWMGA